IIHDDRLPEPLWDLPDLSCEHIDLSARLRRGGGFPGLKTVAAYLGRPMLQELPYPPDKVLSDQEWEEVKRYNAIDLGHTWALLERFAPELQALDVLSAEVEQELRSTPTPRVVEVVFQDAYRREHGVDPPRPGRPRELVYRPVAGVVKPRTPEAAEWYDRITQPILMVGTEERMKPDVPKAQFSIGRLRLSAGAGGLHSLDEPRVYYSTRKSRLVSVDVASFYPSLIATKGIAPQAYGRTGSAIYRDILDRRLRIKQEAKTVEDAAERERLDVQATALKLVLNSTFGKLGDPYSSLYDPAAFLAVTLSGELMLIDLIERLAAVKVRVLSANTDGLFLRVPRRGNRWRKILTSWQRDTGMTLEIEGLKRLAIVATNNYATLDAKGKVKRKGDKLKASMSISPFTSCNNLIVNDAVAEALLRDIPPEQTVRSCSDPVRFCRITRRTGKVTAAVVIDEETGEEIELPKVARWYKAKDSRRHIVHRFGDGHHTTPPGAVGIGLALDLGDGRLPDDIDRSSYIAEARRVVQKVRGYRHRSTRR
ncbi:MAG TPA: DNA polymerase domain-containing protein, partial [Planctomycetota bacterium]|nr:DNA polymerase domain-containing protein [Planctomycetota bacterium]